MEDCCDICGDTGVADALMTCTQCKINAEHLKPRYCGRYSGGKWYCMRTPLEERIDNWLCEECEVRNGRELHVENRKVLNKSRMHSGWGKKVARKTKLISVQEAIKLSTGEKRSFAPSSSTFHSKPPRSNIGIDKVERTPMRPITGPISSQKNLASGPSRQTQPQRPRNMEICERQLQQPNKLIEAHRSVSSPRPSQDKSKDMQKEQPREIQWPHKKGRRSVKKQPFTPMNALPVITAGGNGHTSTELRIGDAENMDNNILLNSKKCLFTPAFDALWKGSFSIQDDNRHGEMNHQIKAHPPSKVRRKVYEFSKQMPKVLHFQVVPARTFWINLFKGYKPDERDIALYFFPSAGESLVDYISLLESISLKGLALREQIADVELLVFTSKLLPVNSQCWEGKYFLWGVFHHMKRDTIACFSLPALSVAAHDQVEDSSECNMEIDMIGGVNVGRMDIAVPREPHREKFTSLGKESAPVVASPASGQQGNAVSRRASNPATTVPCPNIKTELYDLVPPGFEDMYMSRIPGSPSTAASVGGREGKRRDLDNVRSFPPAKHL